jgi:hypothetical protein
LVLAVDTIDGESAVFEPVTDMTEFVGHVSMRQDDGSH